jgi:hypothetical protein
MLHQQEEWNGLWYVMFACGWKIPGSKCGISNELDGSEDDILYEESDALSENNHEDDFSGSDDDFLGFYDC